jgi:hypothetical protein
MAGEDFWHCFSLGGANSCVASEDAGPPNHSAGAARSRDAAVSGVTSVW